MKIRHLGIVLLSVATLALCETAQAAPLTWTFDTIPSGGAISGAPGQTVGWGYSISNLDPSNWLVVNSLTASSFISADPNPLGIFDFPIVAPSTTVTTPYQQGIAGLYEVTVKLVPPVSFESGLFTVIADWFDGDPSDVESVVVLSDQTKEAGYSLTISQPAASVPGPSTWLLLVAGAGVLAFLQTYIPVRSHKRRRPMVKRLAVFLIVATALPLLVVGKSLAGGGFNPPPPGFLLAPPSGNVTAVIVLDPNGPVSFGAPATPTGTFGSIAITRRKVGTATATFQVEPFSTLGELRLGCNLRLTNQRFVEQAPGEPGLPLGGTFTGNWLSADVITKLFTQLNITLVDPQSQTLLLIPAVAGVISQKCVPFPRKDDTLDFLMLNEILEKQHIKPLPPKYPDLTILGATPANQWFPGFLVLEVTIGFLTAGAPTP